MKIPQEIIEAQALLNQYCQETSVSKSFELQHVIIKKMKAIIPVIFASNDLETKFNRHEMYVQLDTAFQKAIDKKMAQIHEGNTSLSMMAEKVEKVAEQPASPLMITSSHLMQVLEPLLMAQRVKQAVEEAKLVIESGELLARQERTQAIHEIIKAAFLMQAAQVSVPSITGMQLAPSLGLPPVVPPAAIGQAYPVLISEKKTISDEEGCCTCVGNIFTSTMRTLSTYLSL